MAVEALAARRAVQFTIETSFHLSSFKGNSEIVINSLRSGDVFHSSVGHILKDKLYYVSSLQRYTSKILNTT